MRLAVFADEERRGSLELILRSDSVSHSVSEFYDSYDGFIQGLPQSKCDAVIVAHKGAVGMQSVRAARILLHRVPIVWLSDDNGFVEESYRLGCSYFSTEEISAGLLSSALERCNVKGENNNGKN